ncbi:MAG: hypothetical protein ACRDF7_04810 [Candidatus Limnocylindrales bacterium]
MTSCSDICDGQNPGTTVLDDGRVIWSTEDATGLTVWERTLSASGLIAVRGALDSTRLFGASGVYVPSPKPGKVPPGHGATAFTFRSMQGDTAVTVVASDPTSFEPEFWDITAQMVVLADLAAKLSAPETWLPVAAWADQRHGYVADRYLLLIAAVPSVGELPPGPDVDSIAWPFADPITKVGQPYATGGQLVENGTCLAIDRPTAEQVAAAEVTVGTTRSLAAPATDVLYPWARGPGMVTVTLRMLLPDQPALCAEGGAW